MAQVTDTLFYAQNGAVTIKATWDDISFTLVSITVHNFGGSPATVTVKFGSRTISNVFPDQADTTWTPPGNPPPWGNGHENYTLTVT